MKDMEEPVESENVHSRSSDGPQFGSLLVAQVQLGPAGPFGTSANARWLVANPPSVYLHVAKLSSGTIASTRS